MSRNPKHQLDGNNDYSISAASGRINDYAGNAVNSPVKKVHRVDLKGKNLGRSDSGSFDGGRARQMLAEN